MINVEGENKSITLTKEEWNFLKSYIIEDSIKFLIDIDEDISEMLEDKTIEATGDKFKIIRNSLFNKLKNIDVNIEVYE